VRASLVDQRKATANQIRGLTSEFGLIAPKELIHLRAAIPHWLEDLDNGLSERFRCLLRGLWEDMLALDRRATELEREIEQIGRHDPVAVRLQQLRGIGPITATALVATVGDASQFASGRQMAASLGLTPKQNSSGGKERLLGIALWKWSYKDPAKSSLHSSNT
jgi:transposase